MQFAWITDPHLNFLEPEPLAQYLATLRRHPADAFLLGGDIGEAGDVTDWLRELDDALQRPLYFVLGNHDFYFGSIAGVRRRVEELCERSPHLHYLTSSGIVPLSGSTALVGHDGWADARCGDYERSLVMMNDYKLIEELRGVNKQDRWPLLQDLGDAAAAHIRRVLPAAAADFREVWLLTHVPPFREACWYDGRISDDEWAPHFTCKAMGDAILEVMDGYPACRLTVLCGHTHGEGEYAARENVRVLTGAAEYGRPRITRTFDAP